MYSEVSAFPFLLFLGGFSLRGAAASRVCRRRMRCFGGVRNSRETKEEDGLGEFRLELARSDGESAVAVSPLISSDDLLTAATANAFTAEGTR